MVLARWYALNTISFIWSEGVKSDVTMTPSLDMNQHMVERHHWWTSVYLEQFFHPMQSTQTFLY